MVVRVPPPVITEYFELYKTYSEKYKPIALLMQIGSFYEMYGIENDVEKINEATKFSSILNIQLTRKNKQIVGNDIFNPLMLGFPVNSLDKYLPLLLSNNYTVVLNEQITPAPNPQRKVTKIISPGVQLDFITDDSNNIVSVFFEIVNKFLFIGMSSIDFSTGSSSVYQTFSEISDKEFSLDEVSKFITSNSPKEIIINCLNTKDSFLTSSFIIQNLDLHNIVHHITLDDIDPVFCNISYQNTFLSKIFPHGLLSPIEFLDLENKNYITISFIKLLQFSYEHNENIIKNLKKPQVILDNSQLFLLNNTVSQLDLFKQSSKTSLLSLIDFTSTVMGKRLLKYRLLNPITNIEILSKRYALIDDMIPVFKVFESHLDHINDIERLHRKIQLNTINPTEFIPLHKAYKMIIQLQKLIDSQPVTPKGFSLRSVILKDFKEFNSLIDSYTSLFDLVILDSLSVDNMFSISFLKPGVSEIIDSLQSEVNTITSTVKILQSELNTLVPEKISRSTSTSSTSSIKLQFDDKDGISLSISSIRSIKLAKIRPDLVFNTKNANAKISSPDIEKLSDRYIIIKAKIQANLKHVYFKLINSLHSKYHNVFPDLVDFVSEIDLVKSCAKCSIKYNYFKPIVSSSDSSFIDAKNIRHPIIELLHQNEKYIPNDISLNDDSSGMVLFGLNSSGKSSLLKSIGINVIMAQAGFFVASDSFKYSPFDYIISRIQGSDDIVKGHSSFIIEMLELRCVLNRSNNKTLVLGDELCRGTEQVSALSIVASSILELSKRKTKFIFATHLHDLTKIPDIISLPNTNFFNLAVVYDEASNTLIFNRNLQKGSGSNLYGLEVAKSMDMPPMFIKKAMQIRRDILKINNNVVTPKKSKYNSKVFVSECHICKSIESLDTHHIKFQHTADTNGNIEHFHKNNLHNLVVLCKSCHQKVHDDLITIRGYINTSKGFVLDYDRKIISLNA
jgi:DNA mismatch repair protein MutS